MAFVPLARSLKAAEEVPQVVVPLPAGPDPRDLARERAHSAALASLAAAEAEARSAAGTLREATESVRAMRRGLVDEVRATTAAVILEAARRIAGDALHADPALLNAIVDEAVRTLGRDGLVVRVAPVDGERVRKALGAGDITVVEDPTITAGCVCEGLAGSIDASVECAVAAVAAVLEQWK